MVENQKAKTGTKPLTPAEPSSSPQLRAWTRYDIGAKRYRGTNTDGPLWSDVVRRITRDLDNGRAIDDMAIEGELSARVLHQRLPVGIENIGTTLVYRPTPGHPDPGKPVSEVPELPEDVPLDKEPEEDARLIDLGMKRGLEETAPDDRQANRTRTFGMWRADDVTEWGNKAQHPIVANARDISLSTSLPSPTASTSSRVQTRL